MLKLCLPVAPCLWICVVGKGLETVKWICLKTYTFYTDSVLNVKPKLTSCLAGVFGGEDVSEPLDSCGGCNALSTAAYAASAVSGIGP